MRPPEFTGGKPGGKQKNVVKTRIASMRPPEFTGGNEVASWSVMESVCAGLQ